MKSDEGERERRGGGELEGRLIVAGEAVDERERRERASATKLRLVHT